MDFGNVLTAMVTPFDNRGNLDLNKTTELVNYLINNGTDGLVVAGTTGESPTLTSEEKLALFKHVVEASDNRVPVIAGTGSNNTNATIQLTNKAEKTGVDAILLVTPYYNKPSQRGLYEHFSAVAKETNLPVMLYNIPGRSGVQIAADTVIELSKVPNIVSIKESSGDLDAIAEIIDKTADNFSVYSGDDGFTLPIKAIGGNGVISVSSHVIGNQIQEMLHAYDTGEVKKAAAIHRRLLPIMKGLFIAPSPSPVKTALQVKGFDVGGVRLPMVPLSPSERQIVADLLL